MIVRGAAALGRRHEVALIFAIMALAALVRFPGLLGDGVWRDQANVYVQVTAPDFGEFWGRVIATEWHPPLYFALAYAWAKLAGTSEVALLALPFACSVATTAVVYALGKDAVSRSVATVAAVLYAVSPVAAAYACEYVYPLAMLLFTLLAWLAARARSGPLGAARCARLAAASALVCATHYVALLYVPLCSLWALASAGGRRRRLIIAVALAAGLLPFAFWLPVFLQQCGIGVPYRAALPLPAKLLFCIGALGTLIPVRPVPLGVIFGLGAAGGCLAAIRSRSLAADAGWFFAMVIAVLAVLVAKDQLEVRYVLPLYGLWCVALAALLVRFVQRAGAALPAPHRRSVALAAAVVAIGIAGADVATTVRTSALPKSGLRAVAFAPSSGARRLYLIAPDYLASTFAFYARGRPAPFVGFAVADRPEVFRLAGYAAAWSRPGAVAQTLARIARASSRYSELDVLVDDRVSDEGQLPYRRAVDTLLAALRARYRLIDRVEHPGRKEMIAEYRFALGKL